MDGRGLSFENLIRNGHENVGDEMLLFVCLIGRPIISAPTEYGRLIRTSTGSSLGELA